MDILVVGRAGENDFPHNSRLSFFLKKLLIDLFLAAPSFCCCLQAFL